jgi:thioredoxin reductase (NADPH)
MTDSVEKVVIIGSGPAGFTAAIYAARAQLRPLLYEGAETEENRLKGTMPLGQLAWTTEVENFPTWPASDNEALAAYAKSALPEDRYYNVQHLYEGKRAHHGRRTVFGPEMMEFMRQQAVNFDTRIRTLDIVSIDLSKRPFTLVDSKGCETKAHSIIIATGASANYLGLESEGKFKNNGVSACAVCDGALPRFRDKPIVVVGGGDSACEEANYLSKFASEVMLVHRRDSLRASKIMAERTLDNAKITPVWDSAVDEVLGSDDAGVTAVRVKNLKTAEQKVIDASGMFVAIGHTPNVKFLNGQLATDPQGFIKLIDPGQTGTSVEGVFAAGDVADPRYKQAITAAGSGCKAALDAERYLALSGLH